MADLLSLALTPRLLVIVAFAFWVHSILTTNRDRLDTGGQNLLQGTRCQRIGPAFGPVVRPLAPILIFFSYLFVFEVFFNQELFTVL